MNIKSNIEQMLDGVSKYIIMLQQINDFEFYFTHIGLTDDGKNVRLGPLFVQRKFCIGKNIFRNWTRIFGNHSIFGQNWCVASVCSSWLRKFGVWHLGRHIRRTISEAQWFLCETGVIFKKYARISEDFLLTLFWHFVFHWAINGHFRDGNWFHFISSENYKVVSLSVVLRLADINWKDEWSL